MTASPPPTKITPPVVRGAYPRARLFRALDRARRARVVWLWAPAGAGKTTLLASYAASRKLTTLFYRVDRSDVDVASVFQHLRDASLRLARRPAGGLPRFSLEVGDVRAFARRYFGAMASELAAPRRTAFVFDDSQEINDDAAFWQVLREGLAMLPEDVTVFFASRRPPPPAFARGVAHGEIAILDFDALRLRLDESRGILRALRRRKSVPETLARTLHDRSGGWAAGLTLLASATGSDRGPSPDVFDGITRQRLFDYFATEVFAALRPEHQELAMLTALLPVIEHDMLDELVEPDQRAAAATFSRELSLVERHEAGWRYHPLFRDFLLAQGEAQLGADGIAAARRKAVTALLERGRADEAFDLACGSRDVDQLRAVIIACAPGLLEHGRTRTLEAWTNALTREQIASDPWLALWRGQAQLMTAPADALGLFEIAASSPDPACAALGGAGALQAMAFVGDDFAAMDPLLDRLLALDPRALPPPIATTVTTAVMTALGFRRPGEAGAAHLVRFAHELVRAAPDERFRKLLSGMLVFHELFFGDPVEADNVVDEILADGGRPADSFAQITVLLARGVRAWLRGAADDAVTAIRAGLDLALASGIHVWDDQLYAIGASATIGAGRRTEASELLQPLRQAAARSRFARGNADFYQAWFALRWHDLDAAELHGERAYRAARELGSPFARLLTATLMARTATATGRIDAAAAYLAEAERELAPMSATANRLPVSCARAALARRTGRSDVEHASVQAVLAASRATGVKAYFAISRDDLAHCAAVALRGHVEVATARALVEALDLDPPAEARALARWPWRVRIRAFGALSIEVRGRDTGDPRARGSRTRELLALTIALGPGAVLQTRIADELWPDADGDQTRARLDTTLLRVRRQLGADGALTLAGGRVSLDRAHVFVDLFAAEDLLRQAETALGGAEPASASDALVEALALLDGPLFDDLEGGVFDARRRRFNRRLAAVVARARAHPELTDPRLPSLLSRALALLDAD